MSCDDSEIRLTIATAFISGLSIGFLAGSIIVILYLT